MMQPPEPSNNATDTGMTTEGSVGERLFRGFVCGVGVGIAFAILCACIMPCLPRG